MLIIARHSKKSRLIFAKNNLFILPGNLRLIWAAVMILMCLCAGCYLIVSWLLKEAEKLFDKANAKTEKQQHRRRCWEGVLNVMQSGCSLLLQFGVVFAGGYMAIQGRITAGVAVVMIILFGQMISPIGVSRAILNLEGLTRIVVTHRLEEELLRQYDRILVLRDGRICEGGSFDELTEKRGYFYALYHAAKD